MAYGSNVRIKLGFPRGEEGTLIQSWFNMFAPGVVPAWK
jgi:hypothetical protein